MNEYSIEEVRKYAEHICTNVEELELWKRCARDMVRSALKEVDRLQKVDTSTKGYHQWPNH